MKIITIENGIYTLTDKNGSCPCNQETLDLFTSNRVYTTTDMLDGMVYFFRGDA